ncbi:ATP-binding protein [filamentous cyanobacterium LEGE 11480]|uniref:ATP-binding protein n=1 Tax=Romeriopsis navalis LEGE 11480 TaxID=2777977 RepID=A0A928Z2M8_9CYAN|nr:hypothetical protein [Romeriopsis navalis]MBE9028535.1 ATP-binding protein [Romeriopsis navalis LEGE 11480]
MQHPPVPVLIISGPVGVGKTSVANAVSEELIHHAIPHTFVDLDQLRYTYPRPIGDRFGSQLGLQKRSPSGKTRLRLAHRI